MSAVITMLDRALILAQHELDALNAGDVESAEGHFMSRAAILTDAYNEHDEENNEDYVMKLIALQGYNQSICEVGIALKEKLRKELFGMSKQTQANKSYMQASRIH